MLQSSQTGSLGGKSTGYGPEGVTALPTRLLLAATPTRYGTEDAFSSSRGLSLPLSSIAKGGYILQLVL